MSEYLQHYGVKGMKWGVRKKRNPNYTEKQRQRDRQFYGRGGERRINSKLNKGYGIQSARNYESDRLHRARNKAQSSASIGRIVGGVAGGIAGYAAPSIIKKGSGLVAGTLGVKVAQKTGNGRIIVGAFNVNKMMRDPTVSRIVSYGGAAVGAALGRGAGAKIGTHASMNLRGYSAKKARNSTSASGTKDTREAADTMTRMIINR